MIGQQPATTRPEGERLQLFLGLKKLWKRHKVAISFAYVLILGLVGILCLRAAGELLIFWNFHGVKSWENMATWKDWWPLFSLFGRAATVDLLSGIAAILIGILISIIIDDATRRDTASLRETADGIRRDVKKIVEEHLKLKAITNYDEVLQCVQEVVDHASDKQNSLYVMNPTASFGFFMTFNVDVVLRSAGYQLTDQFIAQQRRDALEKLNTNGFWTHWDQMKEKQKDNLELITDLGRKRLLEHNTLNARIVYLTLRSTNGENGCDAPYITDFCKPSLQGAQVVMYQKDENKPMSERAKAALDVIDGELSKQPNQGPTLQGPNSATIAETSITPRLYMVPTEILGTSIPDDPSPDTRIHNFEEYLRKDQEEKIRRLEEVPNMGDKHGIEVFKVSELPLQFYMSYPNQTDEDLADPTKRKEGLCIFMFANKFTLARSSSVAAFRTANPSIMDTFLSMLHTVLAEELRKRPNAGEKLHPNK